MRKLIFCLIVVSALFSCSKNDEIRTKIELLKSDISITRNEKFTISLDRFDYMGDVNGYFMFLNDIDTEKATVSATLSVYGTDYYEVSYFPYTDSSFVKSLVLKMKML